MPACSSSLLDTAPWFASSDAGRVSASLLLFLMLGDRVYLRSVSHCEHVCVSSFVGCYCMYVLVLPYTLHGVRYCWSSVCGWLPLCVYVCVYTLLLVCHMLACDSISHQPAVQGCVGAAGRQSSGGVASSGVCAAAAPVKHTCLICGLDELLRA
jgi:hypothetical protein